MRCDATAGASPRRARRRRGRARRSERNGNRPDASRVRLLGFLSFPRLTLAARARTRGLKDARSRLSFPPPAPLQPLAAFPRRLITDFPPPLPAARRRVVRRGRGHRRIPERNIVLAARARGRFTSFLPSSSLFVIITVVVDIRRTNSVRTFRRTRAEGVNLFQYLYKTRARWRAPAALTTRFTRISFLFSPSHLSRYIYIRTGRLLKATDQLPITTTGSSRLLPRAIILVEGRGGELSLSSGGAKCRAKKCEI